MIKMYYDTHAHLNMLNENELTKMLAKAKEVDILEIVSCSTSFHSNKQNLLLSKKFSQIKAAIGLYPLDALELNDAELDKAFGYFEKHINEAIGIGEVGIDHKYAKTNSEKDQQKETFVRFIELAKKYDKPINIHSRYAQRTVLKILESEAIEKVLLHSFTDSSKLMKIASEMKWYIGAGMNTIFNKEVQKRIIDFPIQNLLFETDSPIRFNGEKAMSQDIVRIANKVADIKDMDITKLKKQQEQNYANLFS